MGKEKKTCPSCGGSGGFWLAKADGTQEWVTCSTCDGSGTV